VFHAHRHDHRLGAEPACSDHRHGAVDAERPGLVGSGADDAPPFGASDDNGLATQFGVVALLNGRIEGVHVDVQDVCLGVHHSPALGAWALVARQRYHRTVSEFARKEEPDRKRGTGL